jgi:hypothetical protein
MAKPVAVPAQRSVAELAGEIRSGVVRPAAHRDHLRRTAA